VSREIWAGRRGAGERENQNEGGKAEFRDLGKRNEGGSGSGGGNSRGAESVVFFSIGRRRSKQSRSKKEGSRTFDRQEESEPSKRST
jgi:hypothetical protein